MLNAGNHVTSKDAVFIADLVINAAEGLIFVGLRDWPKRHLPAWSSSSRQLLHDLQRLWTELTYRHLVVRIWHVGEGITRLSKVAAAEVSSKHSCRRNKTRSIRWIGSRFGALIAEEEKHFVFLDRPADCPAVLVPLQRVTACGIRISRVKDAVPQELKNISMKLVRTGFNDCGDRRTGVQPVLRRQRGRLHFEFLQCIRKRKRKVHGIKWIVVQRAVQQICDAGKLAASY